LRTFNHNTADDGSRLTAAGQVLRPNDSRRRNLPFILLRGDRPLHLHQRSLNSDGPDEGPNDSSPTGRSALRDPLRLYNPDETPPESRHLRASPRGHASSSVQASSSEVCVLMVGCRALTPSRQAWSVKRSLASTISPSKCLRAKSIQVASVPGCGGGTGWFSTKVRTPQALAVCAACSTSE